MIDNHGSEIGYPNATFHPRQRFRRPAARGSPDSHSRHRRVVLGSSRGCRIAGWSHFTFGIPPVVTRLAAASSRKPSALK